MAAPETMLTFEVLICPECKSGSRRVTLWAAEKLRLASPTYMAHLVNWAEASQQLSRLGLVSAETLGLAEDCFAADEPVLGSICCRRADLADLCFEETSSPLPLKLEQRIAEFASYTHDSSTLKVRTEHSEIVRTEPQSSLVLKSYREIASSRRVAILGVCLDDLSMEQAIELIDSFIEQGGFHQIATANVDFLTKALNDSELLNILHGCDLVLADGMPLIWSSRLLGVPLRQRVTGADLLPRLLNLSARKKRRIFLLGASEDRSREAATRIQQDFPDAVICGRLAPRLAPLEEMDHEAILSEVNAATPDILLVAFGNPKQEKWIAMHRDRIRAPVCIGVGASIDFVSGKQKRAPIWMQNAGLEWTYRLASEPRRLALRYIENAVFLLRHLSIQLLTNSLQPRDQQAAQVHILRCDEFLTASIVGGFSGATVDLLMAKIQDLPEHCALIVDLSSSTFIAPDAAAAIAHVAHQQTRKGRELWVVGHKPVLRNAIKAIFPAGEPFRTALSVQHAVQLLQAEAAQ